MDWFAPIDIYCERLSADFWSEPFNALTNIAFILAAIVGYFVAKKYNRLDFINGLLIFLTFSIGIGSFLFHTFANVWSEKADLIPIALLAISYIALSVRRFFNKSWFVVVLIGASFFALSAILLYLISPLASTSLAFLNGSHIYAPVLLGLAFLAYMLNVKHNESAKLIWLATITFLISLSFRSMDKSICDSFPLGTHFIWHSLNGIMIGLLLVAIIKYGQKEKAS